MDSIRQHFEENGQGQVFAHFDALSEEAQENLLAEARAIDLEELDQLVASLVKSEDSSNADMANSLEPADFIPLPDNGGDAAMWQESTEKGEAALRAGRVAAFTVAGGQGTRLGYDGPKGTFGVTPVLKKSLFQVFAEKILASSKLYGKPIPWYILTSVINHEATVSFFEENNNFGLPPDKIHFFSQGLMPAVDSDGKILLAEKGHIALSPDGHGGALRALVRSGSIRNMEADGIDIVSYFQVDNPLVRCIDPAFIGFHLMNNSELSSKMVPKAYAEEKVGVFCEQDGKALVVEYSDLPDRLAQETDASGTLRFQAGSIAIHIFDRNFTDRLGSGRDKASKLPFHLAKKKVPYVDASGEVRNPEEPNAYKFEMFVFDALPFAKNPVIIETAREDDFSPVKNAEGVDSAQTSRDDQLRQYARWAKAAGIKLEVDQTGLPTANFEVSPLFGDTGERFVAAWEELSHKPVLADGLVLV